MGSFAVICLVLLAMAGYSVWLCPGEADRLWALPLVCAGARCVSAGAVLGLKPLETSGYHAMGQSPGGRRHRMGFGGCVRGTGCAGFRVGLFTPGDGYFCGCRHGLFPAAEFGRHVRGYLRCCYHFG